MNHRRPIPRNRGLTLIEAMILVIVLGFVVVGVGVGLQGATRLSYITDSRLAAHARLLEKLEQINSSSFTTLVNAIGNANNSLSDTVNLNGQTLARNVVVAYFDPDGTGAKTDIVEVAVTMNGQTLRTRVCQP